MDHAQELADYYNYGLQEHTSMSTGWPSLDPYYKIVPGELSIVTGMEVKCAKFFFFVCSIAWIVLGILDCFPFKNYIIFNSVWARVRLQVQ